MADSLLQLIVPLSRGIVPVTITFGTIGNCLNIAILTRPVLYRHSCSHYLLALAINNLIYCTVFLIIRLLTQGQEVIPLNTSLAFCKLENYALAVCILLSPFFIVLASIDRYCASSANAGRRNFCNINVARRAIIGLVIFFMLIFINAAITVDIQPDGLGCITRSDSLYKQIFIIFEVIMFAVVARLLMVFFGLMTIHNIKQTTVAPIRRSSHRRTEGQLARMLIFQVTIDIILTLPTCVTYLMSILPIDARITPLFAFAYSMGQIIFDFSFATTFFYIF